MIDITRKNNPIKSNLYLMGYIDTLKDKIEESELGNNEVGSLIGKHPQIITDIKNGKRKQLYVEDLVAFSKAFKYDFFKEIQENSLKELYQDGIKERSKKVRVSVNIEIEDTVKERKILETILDKQSVKKLLE